MTEFDDALKEYRVAAIEAWRAESAWTKGYSDSRTEDLKAAEAAALAKLRGIVERLEKELKALREFRSEHGSF